MCYFILAETHNSLTHAGYASASFLDVPLYTKVCWRVPESDRLPDVNNLTEYGKPDGDAGHWKRLDSLNKETLCWKQSLRVHCPGKCIMHLKASCTVIKGCLEYCVIYRRMTGGGDAECNNADCCLT